MKKKMLACSIACALLFAETTASFGVSADALKNSAGVKAVFSPQDDADEEAAQPEAKTITVKAYRITADGVKILLNRKEIELPTEEYTYATYYQLLNGIYPAAPNIDEETLPEDTIILSDWYLSEDPDNYDKIDRYGAITIKKDHSLYYMTKQLPAHYLRFDAGEGRVLWTNSKTTYKGKIRKVDENEIVIPEQEKCTFSTPTAEREGYYFAGWYTAPEGGTRILSSSVISGDKEQTLYAHWEESSASSVRSQYYVKMYVVNDEDGSASYTVSRTVNKGDTYSKLWSNTAAKTLAYKVYNKEDYEPGTVVSYDWYTEKEGGFIIDDSSDAVIPGDTAVYRRKGIFRCHYISFNAGDGELFWDVNSDDTSFSRFEGNVEPAKNCQLIVMEDHKVSSLPTAENGTRAFLGWYTEPEGGTKFDTSTVYKTNGDLKLYAHWDDEGTTEAPRGIKLRIYNVNPDTGAVTVSRDYRGENCETYSDLIYGQNSSGSPQYAVSNSVYANTETPEGMYYKNGYYTAKKDGQYVSIYGPLLKHADHALYNCYDYVPYYHIRFDAQGGKISWVGFKNTSTFPNDRTLADDEIAKCKGDIFGTLPTAINGTRKFLGWFTAPDGGVKLEQKTVFNGNSDTVYYAHWDEENTETPFDGVLMNCYTLNPNTNEYRLYGNYLIAKNADYTEALRKAPGISLPYSTEPVPEGKIRKMLWFSEPEGGICIISSTENVPDQDFSLYCREEKVSYHYVNLDPGDGDLSIYDEKNPNGGYYAETTTATISSSSTTSTTVKPPASDQVLVTEGSAYGKLMNAFQENKEFLGWFTDPVGGTQVTEYTVFTGTSDQTLYAHWKEKVEEPAVTTAPAITTAAALGSTTSGSGTTAESISTTARAGTSTEKAITTTAILTTSAAGVTTTTAKATTATAKGTTTTAKATTTTTKATTTTAKATTTTTKATTTTAKATTTTTKATTTTTKATTTTTKATTTTTKSTTTTTKATTTTTKATTTTTKATITTTKATTTTTKATTTTTKATTTTTKATTTTTKATTTTTIATTTTAKATTTTTKATTTTMKATTTTTKATTTTTKATTTTTKATTTTTIATTTTTKATTTTTKATTTTAIATTTTTKATTTTTKATTTTAIATTTTAIATTTTAITSTSAAVLTTSEAPVTTEVKTETTPIQTTAGGSTPTEPDFLKGDVNDDSTVSVEDAQLALKAYTKRISGQDMGLTEKQIKAADVNQDNELSVDDAQSILKYYTQKYVAGNDITWDDVLPAKTQPRPSLMKLREDRLCRINRFDPESET